MKQKAPSATPPVTAVPVTVILDPRLSLPAKGLLGIILARQHDPEPLTEGQLISVSASGRELYRTAMKELEALGIVERQPVRVRGRVKGFTPLVRL